MAQIDCIARLTKTVYGGAKVVYDDKARSVEMARYGVFWKAQKNFLLGLELNQVGDQRMVEGIINHKVDANTQLGSSITLDLDKRVVSTRSVIEKRFDDAMVFKGRVDNSGLFDVSLTGQLDPTFSATFSTGGSLSNVINGQARCADSVQKSQQTYAGVSFTFTPI
ncbi:hypothetical protein FGO68_gene10967 [Halteria grandinella]|uniref:Uncharacterized protein n=1 Tax=Halteria grandinella TaxID=5974 RepID=A0A8J8T4C0_HALGN|nr:hypothetical protein FGO68_gene10967 [Halteria grandinella]